MVKKLHNHRWAMLALMTIVAACTTSTLATRSAADGDAAICTNLCPPVEGLRGRYSE